LQEVLDYSIQIASGLAAAHTGQIVHRDIKPGNAMVDANGTLKLLDFEIAKRVGADGGSRLCGHREHEPDATSVFSIQQENAIESG